MRALQDPGDLLADPLERPADRGLRRPGGLKLGDQLAGLLHVGVDRQAVVSPQRDREVGVNCGDWVVWQRL